MEFPFNPQRALDQEFYDHCARGELRFQRCLACFAWRHVPREHCAGCGSAEWEWALGSGRAALYSWTICHRAFHPAFAPLVPYVVAIGTMAEGVRLIARLEGADEADLRLDLPMRVGFAAMAPGLMLPVFQPLALRR
jgi:uncharacterized OB-fold protein